MLKNVLVVTGISIISLIISRVVIMFFKKYDIGVYYINKQEEEAMADQENLDINLLRPSDYSKSMDLRGTPTHLCVCGCNIWNVKTIFDNFEIATYFIDMECANCGSLATAPTPLDRERKE